jgi:hypothetical protein
MVVLLHRTVVVHMHFVLVRRYVNDVIYDTPGCVESLIRLHFSAIDRTWDEAAQFYLFFITLQERPICVIRASLAMYRRWRSGTRKVVYRLDLLVYGVLEQH